MAFVSEEITRKDDQEYFNGFGFKDILGDLVEPCWWAIDREKNIFLFPRGGGALEVPLSFGLCVESYLIEIEVAEQVEGSEYDGNLKIHWLINKIKIPNELIQRGYIIKNLEKLIEEAFYGLGTVGIPAKEISEVTVKSTAETIIV